MNLAALRELVRQRRSTATDFLAARSNIFLAKQTKEPEKPKESFGELEAGATLPALKVQQEKTSPNGITILNEEDSPRGTTLSRIPITEKQRADKAANNASRVTTTTHQLVSPEKNLLPIIKADPLRFTRAPLISNPIAALSGTLARLIPEPNSFFTKSFEALANFKKPKATIASHYHTEPTLTYADYTRQNRRVETKKEETKHWKETTQLQEKALAEVRKADSETLKLSSLKDTKTSKAKKHNIGSYLRSLAIMAGINLDSFINLDNRSLSKIVLDRGGDPFKMMGIFAKLGQNFSSTLSILERSGNQHLFGQAIAKGLDISSSAAADNFASRVGNKQNFIA